MGPDRATVLIRGAHVHPLTPVAAVDAGAGAVDRYRSIALAGDRILRLGANPHDLDALSGPDTTRLDVPDWCIVPGFTDAHVHQLEAIQDLGAVEVDGARTIDELLRCLRTAAAGAPPERWVVTHRGWHETNLNEGRLPTTAELDTVSPTQPLMVRRGSHTAVLNAAGLARARVTASRDLGVDGLDSETGDAQIRGRALIRSILGHDTPPVDTRAALAQVCTGHAGRGIVRVRDAGLTLDDVATYEALEAGGGLPVRTDVMIAVPRELDQNEKLAFVDELGEPQTPRGSHLTVTAIKLFADGHIADAALRTGSGGELLMTSHEIAEIAARAVARGWRVGCHVVGDRALDAVLGGYESVIRTHRSLGAGRLVVEHALLADEDQQRRAAELGVGITVQHPLLDLYGAQMVAEWGHDLASRANPVRGWLSSGALVCAGSDGHVAPFDPIRSIAGLATRQTMAAGVLGPGERVPLETAVRLYTVAADWLMGFGGAPGGLVDGAFADLTVFEHCLLGADPHDLAGHVAPLLTVCGGRATHDPSSMWPTDDDS